MDPESASAGDRGDDLAPDGVAPEVPAPPPDTAHGVTRFFRDPRVATAVLVFGVVYAGVVLLFAFVWPEALEGVWVRGTLWGVGVLEVVAVVCVWWPELVELLARLCDGATAWWRRRPLWAKAALLAGAGAVVALWVWDVVSPFATALAGVAAFAAFTAGRREGEYRQELSALFGGLWRWLRAAWRPRQFVRDVVAWLGVRYWAARMEGAMEWVFAYPLFPLQILLFWGISLVGFGSGLGLPDLVWGDEWWMRLWVGASISLLFANALFVRAMLDRLPDARPLFDTQTWSLFGFSADPAIRQVGAVLSRTWLPALAIFYLPVVHLDWVRPGDGVPGMMLLGLGSGVAGTVVLVAWYDRRWHRRWQHTWLFDNLPAFRGAAAVSAANRPVYALATVFIIPAAGFALVFLLEYQLAEVVWSPIWVVCLFLGLFNTAYGFVSFHFTGLKYVLLVLGLLIVLVSNAHHPYKMRHPNIGPYGVEKPLVRLDDGPGEPPAGLVKTPALLAEFHRQWEAKGHTGGKPKLVIVCTTGGGIQAATWTALVLEGLENDPKLKAAGFRNHIRLMTGASGGMQGAALYTTDFANARRATPLARQLARDSLWATVQTMVMHDFFGNAVPWSFARDRGVRLEKEWSWTCREWTDAQGQPVEPPNRVRGLFDRFAATDPPLEKTFAQLSGPERRCECPTLVFSPMLVEDCRRVLISNMAVDWFTRVDVRNHNPPLTDKLPVGPDTVSVPAIEFWRHFPDAYDTFQVGTAVRMSASFPFVGPAVSLPTIPPRRVVDAGYFDNFGINFAAMWLHHYRREIVAHTSGVVILEIRAYPRREEKLRFEMKDAQTGEPIKETVNWAISEASSPLEGIYNLYARSAYFRNDQTLHVLEEAFNAPERVPPGGPPFFTTVTFECNQPAALSWTLPRRNYDELRAIFDDRIVLSGSSAAQKKQLDESRTVRRQTVKLLADWFDKGGD